jgi:hypothetical protein
MDAPVATHTRTLEFPAATLLAGSSRGGTRTRLVVRQVAADGTETDVLQLSPADLAAAVAADADVVAVKLAVNAAPGVLGAAIAQDGSVVRLDLAGGSHHFRAAVVVGAIAK